jgi:hypothetical protein
MRVATNGTTVGKEGFPRGFWTVEEVSRFQQVGHTQEGVYGASIPPWASMPTSRGAVKPKKGR